MYCISSNNSRGQSIFAPKGSDYSTEGDYFTLVIISNIYHRSSCPIQKLITSNISRTWAFECFKFVLLIMVINQYIQRQSLNH